MNNIEKITTFCSNNLNLENAHLGSEYYYQSLPLCLIDAIFSISINYSVVQTVVKRYCEYFSLKKSRDDKNTLPDITSQQSISEFLKLKNQYDFTHKIFCNRNRTSPTNGILKTDAVFMFAEILHKYDIKYLQDIHKIYNNKKIIEEIKLIPGQKSGISIKYFLMLSGDNNLIKPDRHVIRFLEQIIDDNVSVTDAEILLQNVCYELKKAYSYINLRLLDNLIWKFQSSKKQIGYAA